MFGHTRSLAAVSAEIIDANGNTMARLSRH
jgi:hypothetical protein